MTLYVEILFSQVEVKKKVKLEGQELAHYVELEKEKARVTKLQNQKSLGISLSLIVH